MCVHQLAGRQSFDAQKMMNRTSFVCTGINAALDGAMLDFQPQRQSPSRLGDSSTQLLNLAASIQCGASKVY
jgi:hypothetical protein